MPVQLEPLKRVKCTFDDCADSFASDEQMKWHKRREHEHEYCHKCDEDFEDYNDLVLHKIVRPNEHNKACRVCGDEFKSSGGLARHIELVCGLVLPTAACGLTIDRIIKSIRASLVQVVASPSIAPVCSLSTLNTTTAASFQLSNSSSTSYTSI